MSVGPIVEQIREEIQTINALVGNARWYLFGSILRDSSRAADIDLLVVCADHIEADKIRRSVECWTLPRPIDLSILTIEEEAEIGVVAHPGCIPIFAE